MDWFVVGNKKGNNGSGFAGKDGRTGGYEGLFWFEKKGVWFVGLVALAVGNGGFFGVRWLVVAAGFVSNVLLMRKKGDSGFVDVF